MLERFAVAGHAVDIAAIRAKHPDLMSFGTWLSQ